MKSPALLLLMVSFIVLAGCNAKKRLNGADSIIAPGQAPGIARDSYGNIHLVYGSGDSIMYAYAADRGEVFSKPVLIAVLPQLTGSFARGPQIAATSGGLVVTACNKAGDIFSFIKEETGRWLPAGRVNDRDTVAKENLMALAADGQNAIAVWLDLRNKNNELFAAKSTDGGKTWGKNFLVYASPDTTVCECCKPSVAITGSNVFVMFRNWLNGNRDLYLVKSSDGGNTFGQAQKLGMGSWALNGCPMDGGGLVLDKYGNPQTVWNRKGSIYASEPGKEERELGKGKSCTVESVNGKNSYAWVENGNVVLLNSHGVKKVVGAGHSPVIRAVGNEQIRCVWENQKQIHSAVME
jgi:hypothetical protein